MLRLSALVGICMCLPVYVETQYQPNWASLDSRYRIPLQIYTRYCRVCNTRTHIHIHTDLYPAGMTKAKSVCFSTGGCSLSPAMAEGEVQESGSGRIG